MHHRWARGLAVAAQHQQLYGCSDRSLHARRWARDDISNCSWLSWSSLRRVVGHSLQSGDCDGPCWRDAHAVGNRHSRRTIWDAWLVRHRPHRARSAGGSPWNSFSRPSRRTNSSSHFMKLAKQWLAATRAIVNDIEATQSESIQRAAALMADPIQADRWVHTFGCGHATIPVEEMYPRIGGFVGFHPMVELPLTFFTRITGEMGIHQFLFLERAEGYGRAIMKGYEFDARDTMWIFSHTGINNVNIDVALRAKALGLRVVVTGSAEQARSSTPR